MLLTLYQKGGNDSPMLSTRQLDEHHEAVIDLVLPYLHTGRFPERENGTGGAILRVEFLYAVLRVVQSCSVLAICSKVSLYRYGD